MSYTIDDSVDRADDDLRVVKLCYDYAQLEERRRAGELEPAEEEQLRSLELLLVGDPLRRRRHRRIATLVPASAKTPAGKLRGLVLNLSCGGMYLATSTRLPEGTPIKVRVGAPGKPRYIFRCVVKREGDGDHPGLGLTVEGAPAFVPEWYVEDSSI